MPTHVDPRLSDNADDPLAHGPLVPVAAAVRARLGQSIAPSTVTRWCLRGVTVAGSRIRLRAVRTGSGWRTTAPALEHFLREQTNAAMAAIDTPDPPPAGRDEETAQRLREVGLL